MKKKSAKKIVHTYSDESFNRLPVILSLFVSFVILVLSLMALMDNQRNLTSQAEAEQLKVLQNNK
ncbi:MAG: hypothetical protein ABIB98_02765 [bacterium]